MNAERKAVYLEATLKTVRQMLTKTTISRNDIRDIITRTMKRLDKEERD